MDTVDRRRFLKGMAGTVLLGGNQIATAAAAEPSSGNEPHRVTVAQLKVTRDVALNLAAMKKAFRQAGKERARWLIFPEGMLSGYHGGIDQDEVGAAFAECLDLCREHRLTALIGTSWKEHGATFNQVRIVDASGDLVGVYAKRCLTYGDAKWAEPGTTDLVFSANGIRFGTLICNDLWVTPGFSDGPDPRLTLRQRKKGAQVIFQSVSSGSNQRYREYHESNLKLRAAEAKCPIVIVNAFSAPEVNAASGVVGTDFEYEVALPRDREAVQTVQFVPASPV